MTIQECFDYIESSRFYASANVCSFLHTLRTVFESDKVISELATNMCCDPVQKAVFDRLKEVCERPFDEQYENPNDTAIAVYLWLLSQHRYHKLNDAKELVKNTKSLWWGRRILDD